MVTLHTAETPDGERDREILQDRQRLVYRHKLVCEPEHNTFYLDLIQISLGVTLEIGGRLWELSGDGNHLDLIRSWDPEITHTFKGLIEQAVKEIRDEMTETWGDPDWPDS